MSVTRSDRFIRIGGASGYWGDASLATAQLLAEGDLDFIVYDYLAEITMAILARQRKQDETTGYAADFVTRAMAQNLAKIAKNNVRVISNAGGINPRACARAIREQIARQGLDLAVAVVTGDELTGMGETLAAEGIREMFSHAHFPQTDRIGSINAYLGAFPIAAALDRGADIVITGRCVDSAVTLGACIHSFGWGADDFDLLAAGSLAGHVIECGTQATGGNFTDWGQVAGTLADIGYPIVEIERDGVFTVSKPTDTGGTVSHGTVAEQIVYEIGDPCAYVLPDVICDFSQVTVAETTPDRVRVRGARGRGRPGDYKVCLTHHDGYRGGQLFTYCGIDATEKAETFARAALQRGRQALDASNSPDFTETSIEILGSESQFGANRKSSPAREVCVKIAVRHPEAHGVATFLKEATGLALAAPPGLSGFAGTRPRPSPVLALFSFLLSKDRVSARIEDAAGNAIIPLQGASTLQPAERPVPPAPSAANAEMVEVDLLRVCWARSGDKGDNANIGVIARRPEFMPYIWATLDEATVTRLFAHFLRGEVLRYHLPGLHAMNIVLTQVLGGGGTSSLRNDPQGKGYAQILLAHRIRVPKSLLKETR